MSLAIDIRRDCPDLTELLEQVEPPVMSGPPAQKRLKVALPGVPVLGQLAKFHCSVPVPAGVSPGAVQGCRVAVKAVQRVASLYTSEQSKLALHTAVTLSVAGQNCRHLLCLVRFWSASLRLRAHSWTRGTSAWHRWQLPRNEFQRGTNQRGCEPCTASRSAEPVTE